MSAKVKKGLWVAWIIGLPLGLWLVYTFFGVQHDDRYTDVFLLLLISVTVSLFPIRLGKTDIFFAESVQLAVFLQFGLMVEVILTQLSTFVFLAYLRVGKESAHRYPSNSLMFLLVSISSGLVYYQLGGVTGTEETFLAFVPIIGYAAAVFVSNQIFLFIIRRVLAQDRSPLFGQDTLWEIVATILVLPVGLILYILLSQVGTAGIFYVAIPLISLSVVLRLYHSSHKINQLLQETSKIGQQLSERLKVSDTLDFFIEKIAALFPVDFGYILSAGEKEELKMVRLFEDQKGILPKRPDFKKEEGISGEVWATGTSRRYTSRRQWRSISKGFLPSSVQSVVSVPMKRNQKVVGIITLASTKKRTYERHQLMILEVLGNFLAVAVENARNYEKTKYESERCPLTHLYNYRYFTTVLESMFTDLEEKKASVFSIILLDLDNFKRINDTYGHESGNEVLRQLADRLVELVGSRGTAARYGGEEFVVLLPETEETKCYQVAEKIRTLVSNEPFTILHPLKGETRQHVQLTASIGIASAPSHGEDALSLIRNADRAMYTGAKQRGKNRVARYIEYSQNHSVRNTEEAIDDFK